MYAVVSGKKRFTLYHPSAVPYLYESEYRTAQWVPKANHNDTGSPTATSSDSSSASRGFELQLLQEDDDNGALCRPWIAADPNNPDFDAFPLFRKARSLVVEVEAGDVFYMPSMWFHQVEQFGADHTSSQCVAVNFWYDMQFDIKYCYFSLVESLAPLVQAQHPLQSKANEQQAASQKQPQTPQTQPQTTQTQAQDRESPPPLMFAQGLFH